jgi:competence protein ComEC
VRGPITRAAWGQGFVVDDGATSIWVTTRAAVAVLPGDRVLVRGPARAPRGLRSPAAPDRAQVVRDRGARWELSASAVEVLAVEAPHDPWRAAAALQRAASARVAARGGDPVGNALVRAAVLGDRGGLDEDTEQAWRDAGVYHALSVSGLHLAAVALLSFAALTRLFALVGLAGAWSPRQVAAAIALPLAVGYTALTGAEVATVRSLIVVGALLVGEVVERRGRTIDAVGLAAIVVLVDRPSALHDPGFQLSFVAALTLIVGAGGGGQGGRWPWRIAWAVARAIATSTAVTLATAPITAAHFHQLSYGGVIGNLIVTPMLELAAIPLGLLALAVAAVASPAAGPLLDLAIAIAGVGAAIVRALAAWTPSLAVAPPTSLELAAAAAVYAAWALARRGHLRGGRAVMLAVVGTAVLTTSWLARPRLRVDGTLRVTFLDVGQGDAAVIELPDGAVWLVDAGGNPMADEPRAGARPGEIVARFLRHRRIDRIDVAVVSHQHPDHYLGLLAVGAAVPIGELWTAEEPEPEPETEPEPAPDPDGDPEPVPRRHRPASFADVAAWLATRGTTLVHPPLGPHAAGDVTIDVLAPRYAGVHATADPVRTVNDNSLVLAVRRAGRCVLFAGDLEAEGEEALVAAGAPACDVVKVPHHGSRTSSTAALVAATRPAVAVISLGRGNRFGFPARSVLDRWRGVGARVLRTDVVGAVTVTVDRAGRLAAATVDPAPGSVTAGAPTTVRSGP